jgi:hypothetical protein
MVVAIFFGVEQKSEQKYKTKIRAQKLKNNSCCFNLDALNCSVETHIYSLIRA